MTGAAPRSAEAVAAVVAEAAERRAFVTIGDYAESPAARASEPERERVRLDLRALDRIVEFAPEDQTVSVECGITFAALDTVLAEKGQRLMLDASDAEQTIGAAVATNAFGPRRHLYGTFKDVLLGIALVRVDGTIARAGGSVVKNVAGFDVAKLMVGSFGTLALMTSATLRVHPRPEAARAFRIEGLDPASLWRWVVASRDRRLDPAAVLAARSSAGAGATLDLSVLVEGFGAGVAAKTALLAELAAALGVAPVEIEPETLAAVDRRGRSDGAPLRVRVAVPSAALHGITAGHLDAVVASLSEPSDVVYPTLGIARFGGRVADAEAAVVSLLAMRAAVEAAGGSLALDAAPPEVASRIDPLGSLPPSLPIMRAVKARFDPDGRLNRGAFPGGLW